MPISEKKENSNEQEKTSKKERIKSVKKLIFVYLKTNRPSRSFILSNYICSQN